MNKELEDKLAENAANLLEFVEKSSSFVVEQAPLYVQELIPFHFFENAFTFVTSVLIMLAMLIPFFWFKRVWRWADEEGIQPAIMSFCLPILIICIQYLTLEKSGKECFKAKYAPRVLIIEKLRGQ